MKISLIAAQDKNGVIGYQNAIPWHVPDDLKQFREKTRGKPIIMGRQTFLSLKKPLPDRKNIVLSRDPCLSFPGCFLADSIEKALFLCEEAKEVMIIGGAQIYTQFFPLADNLYLSVIDGTFLGDTYFPAWEKKEWDLIATLFVPRDKAGQNSHAFTLYTYSRSRAENKTKG